MGVVYDADGTRYGRGLGLMLVVDGVVVTSSPTLAHITHTIEDGHVTQR